MSGKLKSLVFAGFAFLLMSLPAFSQMTTLEGQVKGADGKPVAGATIQFDRTDIKGQYKVKTDKKGKYGHYGLPAGRYDVTVIVDGKPVAQQKGVQTKYTEMPPLDFDLAKTGAAEEADAPDRALSASEKANRDKASQGARSSARQEQGVERHFPGRQGRARCQAVRSGHRTLYQGFHTRR